MKCLEKSQADSASIRYQRDILYPTSRVISKTGFTFKFCNSCQLKLCSAFFNIFLFTYTGVCPCLPIMNMNLGGSCGQALRMELSAAILSQVSGCKCTIVFHTWETPVHLTQSSCFAQLSPTSGLVKDTGRTPPLFYCRFPKVGQTDG